LINQWTQIQQLALKATIDWCSRNDIRRSDSPEDILITPSCIANDVGLTRFSAIHSLASGFVPSYILANMDILNIRTDRAAIAGRLIYESVRQFREVIWKPRCTLHVAKERSLSITAADKKNFTNNTVGPRLRPPENHPNVSAIADHRWKYASARGANVLEKIIEKGVSALDKGWAMTKDFVSRSVVLGRLSTNNNNNKT
jgi:hypothetical protein